MCLGPFHDTKAKCQYQICPANRVATSKQPIGNHLTPYYFPKQAWKLFEVMLVDLKAWIIEFYCPRFLWGFLA